MMYNFFVKNAQSHSGNDSLGFMMMNYPLVGFWGSFVSLFFMIIFWGIVIFALISFFRFLAQGRKGNDAALDILKARYAKGEIDKKEFEKRKKDIYKD